MDKEIFFKFKIRYIQIDLNQIFKMKPSEFETSISIERDDENTAENYRNCYVADKSIVSKLSKISIPNFDSEN